MTDTGGRVTLDRRQTRDAGFTLTEAMTVVAVLAMLCFIVIASYSFAGETTRRIACTSNQRMLENAVPTYQAEHGGRPPATLSDLAPFVARRADIDRCASDPDLLLEYDPSTGDVTCRIHPTP